MENSEIRYFLDELLDIEKQLEPYRHKLYMSDGIGLSDALLLRELLISNKVAIEMFDAEFKRKTATKKKWYQR